jgi:hypothetical protein
MWELQGLGFFTFQFQWGPSFIMKASQNLSSIVIQTPSQHDWSIVCNTFIFVFVDIVMKITYKREIKQNCVIFALEA